MSILIPIRNRLFNRLPYSVLMEFSHNGTNQGRSFGTLNGLTPVALCLIPRRRFGQGRKIQIFGHAQKKSRSKYPDAWPFIFLVPIIITVSTIIDYDELKKKFGWSFPKFTALMRGGGYAGGEDHTALYQARKQNNSEAGVYTGVAENREEIHKFMQREAMKRYHQEVTVMARQDSELKALLDTDDNNELERLEEITPDKEVFKLKKFWVRDYKDAVRDSEKDGDFTVVEPSIEEKISGKWNMFKSKVFAETPGDFDAIDSNDNDSEPEESQNMGFRSRKIAEYEDRLRQYSTPDKIFRYFATYKVVDKKGESHLMMTPQDFLRSITPGLKQPENLGLDNYVTVNAKEVENVVQNLGMEEESIFQKLSSGGLICFSDYIFLLTVLSTSRRHFEVAFKMFDLNGDGDVDAKEFEVVTNLMKSQSSMGARHRDHQNTGNTFKGINSGLITYFFGENKEGILTVEKFLEFQRALQNEILRLEFYRKSSGNSNTVREKEFADLLIAYAGFPAKKKARMLKRVKKAFHSDDNRGITIEDFLNFYQVLYSINDIDTALTFYNIAGAPIERSTFKHVAHTVAGVDLSDHVIDVVFVLFDENGDGKLSNKEFISVMKQRVMRGLEKPKNTGVGKIFSAVAKCASDTLVPTVMITKN